MNQTTIPDYRLYHLHELETALKNLDALTNPEEAKVISEFIQKGGYRYPVASAIPLGEKSGHDTKDGRAYSDVVSLAAVKQVAFASVRYKFTLVFVLSSLLLLNIIGWLFSRNGALFVPIAFQGCVLTMVFLKHRYTRALIKVWSSFLIAAGVTGFLAMLFLNSYQTSTLIWHAVSLSVGLGFLLLANRSVLLIPYISHSPLPQEASSVDHNGSTVVL